MAPDIVQLTPAQIGFCKKAVSSFDLSAWIVTPAGFAGSDRRFVRIREKKTKESYVLVVWDSGDHDWDRFISVQRDVSPLVPFLPGIYAYDAGLGLILEEDLGEMTMKNFCTGLKGTTAAIEKQYKSVLDALVQWHSIPEGASAVIASRDMDLEMFEWESDYFQTHCVREFFGLEKLLGTAWDIERRRIAAEAAALPKVCIHRDFQSENILLRDKRVRFVDYQGARRGPASYDVASLLYDPYIAKLTPVLNKRLFDYYLSVTPAGVTERSYFVCSLQRLMQALGAYGNLSIHKGRERYKAFIPVALRRLSTAIRDHGDVPELKRIVDECLAKCVAGKAKG